MSGPIARGCAQPPNIAIAAAARASRAALRTVARAPVSMACLLERVQERRIGIEHLEQALHEPRVLLLGARDGHRAEERRFPFGARFLHLVVAHRAALPDHEPRLDVAGSRGETRSVEV